MVPGVALAEVVQQRTEHEQVWPIGSGDELGGVGAGLHEVTVHREAVVGVPLRLAPDRLPLGQHTHPQAHLIQRFHHGDRTVSGQQQVDERLSHLHGPRLGESSRQRGQPVER